MDYFYSVTGEYRLTAMLQDLEGPIHLKRDRIEMMGNKSNYVTYYACMYIILTSYSYVQL